MKGGEINGESLKMATTLQSLCHLKALFVRYHTLKNP